MTRHHTHYFARCVLLLFGGLALAGVGFGQPDLAEGCGWIAMTALLAGFVTREAA